MSRPIAAIDVERIGSMPDVLDRIMALRDTHQLVLWSSAPWYRRPLPAMLRARLTMQLADRQHADGPQSYEEAEMLAQAAYLAAWQALRSVQVRWRRPSASS